jgi:6-phosphofructokinase 1
MSAGIMISPESTKILHLGACSVRSPAGLGTRRGSGAGAIVADGARVRYQVECDTGNDLPADVLFEKAGPREQIFFEPGKTRAAIVTCGGLCPGLNNVIRSACLELLQNYGVQEVLGIRYGYAGLNPAVGEAPIRLTPDLVDDIHNAGGTMLGTSRGPQPVAAMVDFLVERGVQILLCVGGDGTLNGAGAIAGEVQRRGLAIAVIGIPKTIDNDVMYITRTFGFGTATEVARKVLDCAHNEAKSALNGVGLVKVMGRHAGFIAAAATLASQNVNFCFVPEVPFALEGRHGFLEVLAERLDRSRHAVVVIAEGAGQNLVAGLPSETDASGNPRLADIGAHLKQRIVGFFAQAGRPVDVKYIDPSYIIRSTAANCEDSLLCDQLARHAVHAAMAGKTNLVVGFWNTVFTHIPIPLATAGKKRVDPEGRLWNSVLAATNQPRTWT